MKGRNLIILTGLSKVNLRIFTSKTLRQNSQNQKKKNNNNNNVKTQNPCLIN